MMSGPIGGARANFSPQESTKSWLVTIQPTQLSVGSENAYVSLSTRFSVGCFSKIDWAQGISLEGSTWTWIHTTVNSVPLELKKPLNISSYIAPFTCTQNICSDGSKPIFTSTFLHRRVKGQWKSWTSQASSREPPLQMIYIGCFVKKTVTINTFLLMFY